VVESHSEHLLRRLQRRIADQTIEPKKMALYFCEAESDGSKLVPLNVDIFGNIMNWPKSFFGDEFGEMAAIAKAAMDRKKGLQE
jgi:predicted ATPase